jgi:hypothetical protein
VAGNPIANPVEGRAMRSISSKIKVVCATIGLAMSMEQSAHAASSVILRTPSVVPDPTVVDRPAVEAPPRLARKSERGVLQFSQRSKSFFDQLPAVITLRGPLDEETRAAAARTLS